MGLKECFHALSDETRREILRLLRSGSMTAGDIAGHFSMSAATISHHLSVLREAELVADDKRGKYIYYELNTTVFEEMLLYLQAFKGGEK